MGEINNNSGKKEREIDREVIISFSKRLMRDIG